MKKIRILFAEDHEMVRNGIKLMLTSQKLFQAEITDAADGVEAIQLATKNTYDLFLLDINLPLKNGIDVIHFIKAKLDDPKILVLTMHNEDYVIKEALDAGARGYILKSSGIEELTRAIMTVSNGSKYYSNEVTQIILDGKSQFAQENISEKLKPLQNKFRLTFRELELLKFIAEGYTDKQLAEKFNISVRTAGNHRFNISKKMKVRSSVELASIALRFGMV